MTTNLLLARTIIAGLVIALCSPLLACAAPPSRPDPTTTSPLAICKLQTIAAPRPPVVNGNVAIMMPDDPEIANPLANYERTPLGDWRMPAPAERDDPWIRLLLLAPKQPIVIDAAVRIDGKSFRDVRDTWIDSVIAGSKSTSTNAESSKHDTASADASSFGKPSESRSPTKKAKNAKNGEKPEADKPPGVAAVTRSVPTMRERLRDYLAAAGGTVSREEVSWLVAESDSGPPIVVLDPSLSWQRAGEEPLWSLLDQNADGVLSASEINDRETMFRRADIDSNDVVEVSEIRRLAKRPANLLPEAGYSLVVQLDASTDWDSLARNVAQIYQHKGTAPETPANKSTLCERIAFGDASLNAQQLHELCGVAADVTLRVDFRTNNAGDDKSGLAVLAGRADLVKGGGSMAARSDVMSIDLDGDVLEVSAGQQSSGNEAQSATGQLGVGAVIDGYSLLRMVDSDQDQRLSLRERETLGGLLHSLDRNGDGQVGAAEVPVPIRLAFTLGPHVHELLRSPAGAARTLSPHESINAPEWFISMDKNHDGDISRAEFLGTNEQFKQLDVDGDGLISVREAQQAHPQK